VKKHFDSLVAMLTLASAGFGAIGCAVVLWAFPIVCTVLLVVGVLWMCGVL
jgi:hypothetical protein